MEKATTLFLKITLLLLAVPALALCLFGLPWVARETDGVYPASWVYPALGVLYAATVPYFVALYQTFKLLNYIDGNNAFSEFSVKALKNIKYCAIAVTILSAAALPYLYLIAEKDDAPGLILLGMVVPSASVVIAVFAAVLQKLFKNAIDIKSENDLTV